MNYTIKNDVIFSYLFSWEDIVKDFLEVCLNKKIEKVEDPADYKGGDSMGYNYEVGDIVTLKKPHPCGSKEWEILRVGADFRLKCMGCGHQIMTARKLVEKNTKDLKKKA